MKTAIVVCIAVASVLPGTSARAQDWKIGGFAPPAGPASAAAADPAPVAAESGGDHGPEAGEFEFTLGGSGSNNNDFDAGGFGFNTSLGFFLADSLEISARQTLQYADFGESTWIGFTRAALDIHFEIGALVPFVGANAGVVYGDDIDQTFEAAPEAGIKIYVLEKTFVYGLAEYQFFFDDTNDAGDSFDDGQFVYTIGIGFNFL